MLEAFKSYLVSLDSGYFWVLCLVSAFLVAAVVVRLEKKMPPPVRRWIQYLAVLPVLGFASLLLYQRSLSNEVKSKAPTGGAASWSEYRVQAVGERISASIEAQKEGKKYAFLRDAGDWSPIRDGYDFCEDSVASGYVQKLSVPGPAELGGVLKDCFLEVEGIAKKYSSR